jgi:hypothetical protein
MEFKYDVAFSFAGEDRKYVEDVANVLKEKGIRIFYDKFEIVDLWGKDLGIHFDYVYRKSAKYCVPFISKYYKEKVWTTYEIKSAISKAIETNEEYILPARFDDTELPGIRPTIGYINLKDYSPNEFADLLMRKIKLEPNIPITKSVQDNRLADIHLGLYYNFTIRVFQPTATLTVNITNLNKDYRYFYEPRFMFSEEMDGGNSIYFRDKMSQISFPIKMEYGEVSGVSYLINHQSLDLWKKFSKEATIKAIANTTIGEAFESNPIEISNIIKVLINEVK